MIFKSSIRGFSGELADHLGNEHDNETTTITKVGGELYRFDKHGLPVADELRLMFSQMDMEARGHGKDDNHIYHVSLSPEQPLEPAQWSRAWALYEAEFDLEKRPFIEVTHEKQGRLHKHRAYYALDERGRGLNISHSYPRNEKIARVIEHEFGHDMTAGRHNRSVMKWLQVEGKPAVVQWMEQQKADQMSRPAAAKSFDDHRQEQRTDWPKKQAQADVKEVYSQTDNGKGFEAALIERGYFLARGDDRPWVVLDPRGGIHSAPRYAGVKKAEFEQKVSDLKWEHLPSIKQVQAHIQAQDEKKAKQTKKDGGQGGSGSAGAGSHIYKDNSVSRMERAQTFKTLNETLRQERLALRKGYQAERVKIWKGIGADYETKKSTLKTAYKPLWKEQFSRKHEELKLFDQGTRNLAGRVLMAVKYRDQIGREDMSLKERVSAYVQHIVSQKKWLDGVEGKYGKQKQELFQQYKIDCKEMYKENRAAWQPAIEQAQKGYREESKTLVEKQAAIRQSVDNIVDENVREREIELPQKSRSSAIDRVAALRDKNKDRDGAERER